MKIPPTNFSTQPRVRRFRRLTRTGATFLTLACAVGLQATVLDNFSGSKTGWTDSLNSGTVTQSGGQFVVASATNSGALTYSAKTSASFSNAANQTQEFRVDVNTVSPPNGDTNALAILGWVPTGGALLGSGYSLSVGSADVRIQRGSSVLYATNFTAGGTNLANTNITMVLRMTPSGGSVTVNARVYARVGNGVIGQYFTTLFEYTAVDSSGLIGSSGNATLGVKNQASPYGSSVAFANLQVFVTAHSVLDDFNNNPSLNGWTVFRKNPGLGDSVTVNSSGQLDVLATIADASGGFAGVYSANNTYKIIDGGRVEFQLDVINNPGGNSSYSALGYLPVADTSYIYGIISYHLAHDYVGHTIVLSGKGYNEWWAGRNDIQPPTTPPGCRYTLTMTGEGSNCRIESRMEDLSVADVNDPARVVFQTEFVDTPAADPGLNEASVGNLAPYLNLDGRFIITTFNSGALPPGWAEVIYDNAVVNQTVPPKAAPILANVTPTFGANFLPATTTVSFDAMDATNLPVNSLFVTLNGVQYGNGSPGVTITPNTDPATTRHFSLTGVLATNANYVGSVQATDANGLASSAALVFDTFLTNVFVVECEEYNFSTNGGVSGGVFIDNPLLIPEGNTDPHAYNGQLGLGEVDFHDNRGDSWLGGADANHTFRTQDPVYTSHSSDPARAKYINAGGPNSSFYEEEVEDIYDGDWLNYTHTYPAGTYNVFLRQATFKILNSLVTLERVVGDPTQTNQSTTVLGSFIGTPTGIGLFANVPLQDGTGNPIVLRFPGGIDTLRLMNRVTGDANLDVGNLEQNYMVFAPVPDPGTLRPILTSASPQAGQMVSGAAPDRYATLANRDTTVNTNSILLLLNGVAVPASLTPTAGGATVTWSLSVLPPTAVITNTLVFQDSAAVWITNTWTYGYPFLAGGNALPIGSLTVRGFDVRTVQSDNGGVNLDNSLSRALQQLAIPPQIPIDLNSTSIVQVLNWNQSGTPTNVPGLCAVGAGEIKNIAVESLAYLELTAGAHRFHVVTDDRAGFYSGARLEDPNGVTVWEAPDNTADAMFDFVVGATGLYPARFIWEQTGGGAVLAVTEVNAADNSEVLINDPSSPSGVAKAWYPIACSSSATLDGPYTVDPTAVNSVTQAPVLCNGSGDPDNQTVTGGTMTIPQAASTRFYRIQGPRLANITGFSRVGSNLVLTYQVQ
jgi:hypothetical protein